MDCDPGVDCWGRDMDYPALVPHAYKISKFWRFLHNINNIIIEFLGCGSIIAILLTVPGFFQSSQSVGSGSDSGSGSCAIRGNLFSVWLFITRCAALGVNNGPQTGFTFLLSSGQRATTIFKNSAFAI